MKSRKSVGRQCRCGHSEGAHSHFRRGTDCSGCGCQAFRRVSSRARLTEARRPRAVTTPVTPDTPGPERLRLVS